MHRTYQSMDKKVIDINCDMGESTHLWNYSLEQDLQLLNYVSSINLACGAHAGDPIVASTIIESAYHKNLAIGAHPSLFDRENFGRSNSAPAPNQLFQELIFQIAGLKALVNWSGAILHHVKPHGALYNMAANDKILAGVVIDAVKEAAPEAQLYCLSGSGMATWAKDAGILVRSECFSDRTYQIDGTLTSRKSPNALIENKEEMLKQVIRMASNGTIICTDGSQIELSVDTICIHGDGKFALEYAKAIKQELTQHGIAIQWN